MRYWLIVTLKNSILSKLKSPPSKLHEDFLPTDTKCHTGAKLIPCLWIQTDFGAGTIAIKIRLGGIYSFLAAQNGLGETGESYLVGKDFRFSFALTFL